MTDVIPIPVLNKKSNGRISSTISAISGSGKSVLFWKIIDQLQELYKHIIFVLFTQASTIDPVFEDLLEKSNKQQEKGIKPTFVHVCLNNDPYLFQITVEDLSDCLTIYDDWESLSVLPINKFLISFMKDLFERSRKQNTAVIIINHMAQQGYKTKSIIFDANSVITFPATYWNSC